MPILGVVGTGHLATYVVTALRRGGFSGRVLLSPRNAERAEALARSQACTIAASNAAVVASADIVLLSVRPHHAIAALEGLAFSSRHTVLSAMAGIRLADLKRMLPGAGRVHLIMPLSYIEEVPGPVPVFPPPSDEIAAFLAQAGEVVAIDSEKSYEASLLAACAATWVYDLAHTMTEAFVQHGLSPEAARALTLGNIAGSAGYALHRPKESLLDISASIATEGTYTKLGLDQMKRDRFDKPWRAAIAAIAAKLG